MKRSIAFLLICCALATLAQSIKKLKQDMYGIASDATEGRFTGSPGYLKAAEYIIRQLKAAGVQPGWTEKGKKTYLQPVPFSWDDYTGTQLISKGKDYGHDAQNFIVVERGIAKAGKWVVLPAGDLVKGKPAGVVLLPTLAEAKDWETTTIRQYRFGYMHYLPDGVNVAKGTPAILASPSLAKLLVPGDSVEVQMKYRAENRTGYNVIGTIPGKGKKLRQRAIVVGAHLDHIGRIGRHIYNGANDDASGCVAELGAVRILAAHRPKHTVICAFFCGEELGLKGSNWFAGHLPVVQSAIAMTINLEQLGSPHRSFRGVWALGDTVFKKAFYHAGNGFPAPDLQFSPTDSVKDELGNTDTYSFMSKHIPSVLLGSGGFDEHHTPQDKIDLIDFQHLQKAAGLLQQLIRMPVFQLKKFKPE